jgi:ABC-2 type transport system permease protein
MITFWTTRVSAIFELYFGLELILSGRLVPLTLMPQWVQDLSNYLPFKWTFYFPIEALVGSLTPQELWMGVGTQIFWITIGAVLLSFVWRAAIKQFSAVGG